MDLVKEFVGPSSAEQLARAIDQATRQYASEGITSFTDAGIGCPGLDHSPVEIAAYQLAERAGWLRCRAQLMVHNEMMHELTAHADDAIERGLDLGLHTGFGSDWLSVGAMKIWVDGLGIEGAAGTPDFDNDPELLRRDIIAAHQAGWQVAAHAMGDHAIDLVLDALAEAASGAGRPPPVQVSEPRHRIEHGALIRPDQLWPASAGGDHRSDAADPGHRVRRPDQRSRSGRTADRGVPRPHSAGRRDRGRRQFRPSGRARFAASRNAGDGAAAVRQRHCVRPGRTGQPWRGAGRVHDRGGTRRAGRAAPRPASRPGRRPILSCSATTR